MLVGLLLSCFGESDMTCLFMWCLCLVSVSVALNCVCLFVCLDFHSRVSQCSPGSPETVDRLASNSLSLSLSVLGKNK